MRTEDLAVIIPTRDRWPILRQTIDALVPQATGAEIIVVVDGMDQSLPPLEGVRFVTVPKGGPGAARNAGVAATARQIVLFLGDDMIPASGLVEEHLDVHRRHSDENVAVLGHVEWHESVAGKALHRWLDRTSMQFDFTGIPSSGEAGWGRFYSCNVSLKRSFFLRSGGFHPDFAYYYEDLDAAWRLHQNGLILKYAPGALAFHLHDYDVERLQTRFRGVARGELMMRAKHEWFEPWFEPRFRQASKARPEAAVWGRIDGRDWPGRVGAAVRAHADRWYWQRMAASFLEAWDAAIGGDEGLEPQQISEMETRG